MLCKTKKKNTFVTEISKGIKNVERSLRLIGKRRGARVVEEARLESVYTPKVSRVRIPFSPQRKFLEKQLKQFINY